MKKLRSLTTQHTVIIRRLLSMLAGVVLVVAIYAVLHNGNQTVPPGSSSTSATTSGSGTPATTPLSPYAVLAPATVASKTAECSESISYSQNGNSGPIQ